MAGDTLQELRIAFSLAEQEREGGVSSHVSPMLKITDIGQLMVKLHYKIVTSTADMNTLYFDDAFSLGRFLRDIGESNGLVSRRENIKRETWIATAAIYNRLFSVKEGKFAGLVPASFDIVHYVGWKEHESQMKPLSPGTRGVDLKTLAEEIEDNEMEQGEIAEIENKIISKVIKKKK